MPIFREDYRVFGTDSFMDNMVAIILDIVRKNGLGVFHDVVEVDAPRFGPFKLPAEGIKIPTEGSMQERGLAVLAQLLTPPAKEERDAALRRQFRLYGIIPGTLNVQLMVSGKVELVPMESAHCALGAVTGAWEMLIGAATAGVHGEAVWDATGFAKTSILDHRNFDAAMRHLVKECARIREEFNLRPLRAPAEPINPYMDGRP